MFNQLRPRVLLVLGEKAWCPGHGRMIALRDDVAFLPDDRVILTTRGCHQKALATARERAVVIGDCPQPLPGVVADRPLGHGQETTTSPETGRARLPVAR